MLRVGKGGDSPPSAEAGGRIEVLVQSLDGIRIDNEKTERPSYPWVTAAVTFSGSSRNMKVCSSSVCGITGQLLVESEPVIPSSLLTAESPRLAAQWVEEEENGSVRPHLTMPFTSAKDSSPKRSLEKGNRGANFVKRELELSKTESTVTDSTGSTSGHDRAEDGDGDDDECRSRSAVWSDSGATMPEIIEMYVRLRHNFDNMTATLWDGVAFLVVYGHEEDRGSHVLELPIQKASFDRHELGQNSSFSNDSLSKKSPRMRLASDARLTVQVKVVPCRPTPSTPVASSTIAAVPRTSPDAALSQSAMMAELGPVMEKLVQHERLAKALCRNQRRAMNVDVPTYAQNSPLPRPPPAAETGAFCHVPVLGKWTSLLSRVASMAVHCDTSMAHQNDTDSLYGDEDSTIATRESLAL